jgi:hypothetical protein
MKRFVIVRVLVIEDPSIVIALYFNVGRDVVTSSLARANLSATAFSSMNK